MLYLPKVLYFQRKHKEKHIFPLAIETFLLYFQRKLTICHPFQTPRELPQGDRMYERQPEDRNDHG